MHDTACTARELLDSELVADDDAMVLLEHVASRAWRAEDLADKFGRALGRLADDRDAAAMLRHRVARHEGADQAARSDRHVKAELDARLYWFEAVGLLEGFTLFGLPSPSRRRYRAELRGLRDACEHARSAFEAASADEVAASDVLLDHVDELALRFGLVELVAGLRHHHAGIRPALCASDRQAGLLAAYTLVEAVDGRQGRDGVARQAAVAHLHSDLPVRSASFVEVDGVWLGLWQVDVDPHGVPKVTRQGRWRTSAVVSVGECGQLRMADGSQVELGAGQVERAVRLVESGQAA